MSNNNDIDTSAFGLPADANTGAGFMYGDGDLGVDETDPIYMETVAAMKAAGMDVPKPGEETRPPAMPTSGDGETPPVGDGSEVVDDTTPPVAPVAPADPATPEIPEIPGLENVQPPADDADLSQLPGAGAVEGGPSPADDGTTPPAQSSLSFNVDGQDMTLDAAQAEYLIRVNSWLEQVPDATKQAWSGIETGTHVAVDAAEYAALQAKAAAPPVPAPVAPRAPNIDDLDADQIAYIRSLEAQVPVSGGQPTADTAPAPQQPQQPDATAIAAAAQYQAAEQVRMRGELDTTNVAYAAKYGLTPEQMEHLGDVTARLQVIPSISRSLTQYSPTGAVIHQASFSEVINQAYEIAMAQDPTLRKIKEDLTYNQRVAADAQRNAATNAKKAKAGTLASSPSAAAPVGGKAPGVSPDNKMDLQATSTAIAAHLATLSETP